MGGGEWRWPLLWLGWAHCNPTNESHRGSVSAEYPGWDSNTPAPRPGRPSAPALQGLPPGKAPEFPVRWRTCCLLPTTHTLESWLVILICARQPPILRDLMDGWIGSRSLESFFTFLFLRNSNPAALPDPSCCSSRPPTRPLSRSLALGKLDRQSTGSEGLTCPVPVQCLQVRLTDPLGQLG